MSVRGQIKAASIRSVLDVCDILGIPTGEVCGLTGHGWYTLLDENGELKDLGAFTNLITDIGDQYYGERAAGISSPPAQVTGMKLGTSNTQAQKTGAGAALVGFVTGSLQAIDSTWPKSSQPGGASTPSVPSARQIQWQSTWAAGAGTGTLQEVVITNNASNVAGTAADTISRAVLATVTKGSADQLTVTWNHNLLGA